jgi:hypothetical protein
MNEKSIPLYRPFNVAGVVQFKPSLLSSHFIVPDLGDKVDSGIQWSYRPARLQYIGWQAGTTTQCRCQLYPPFREYEFRYSTVHMANRQVLQPPAGVNYSTVYPPWPQDTSFPLT